MVEYHLDMCDKMIGTMQRRIPAIVSMFACTHGMHWTRDVAHVPPVPSIEHWKRDQYRPVAGGNFTKSVPTCMRYASVRRLEVFENPWKDARKFWQPDWVPKRNRYR